MTNLIKQLSAAHKKRCIEKRKKLKAWDKLCVSEGEHSIPAQIASLRFHQAVYASEKAGLQRLKALRAARSGKLENTKATAALDEEIKKITEYLPKKLRNINSHKRFITKMLEE